MKIGRNSPCPCGSGRKYKHCCLSKDEDSARTAVRLEENTTRFLLSQNGFDSPEELDAAMRRYQMYCENLPEDAPIPTLMEFLERANHASDVSREMGDELRGRHFADMDELERFTEEQIDAMSSAPLEDFEGISSGEMHRIISESFDGKSDFLEISDELPDDLALSSELVGTAFWLLRYIAEHGGEVRLTARGNYPRILCRSYLEKFDPWFNPKEFVSSEAAMPILFSAHIAVAAAGYTVETASKSLLTTDGVVIITRSGWAELFTELLPFILDEMDWQIWQDENLQHDHFTIIQDSAIFSLYLLHRHPTGTTGDFFRRFAKAFPAYIQPANGNPDIEDFFRLEYETLFFDHFCALFGLVRIKPAGPEGAMKGENEYEATDLFRTAFKWKLPRPRSG